MSIRPDPDLAIAAWLVDEAHDGAPDRLLEATRRQLTTTKQRRAWWPAWRFRDMNTQTRLAITGAAVVAVAAVGLAILPRSPSVGPGASPSPTATTSPTPSPAQLKDGPLAAGRYTTQPFSSTVHVTLTVPDGWYGFGDSGVIPAGGSTGAPDGMGLTFMQARNLYSDPCKGTTADVPVGPSVDDLVTALGQQTAYDTTTPRPITLSGFTGQFIDVLMPTDVDFGTCTNSGGDPAAEAAGLGGFFIWESVTAGGPNVYAQGPGDRFHLRILNVGGSRVIVMTQDFPGTSAADRAELEAIVDSITITN